jgi:hypothetical protein
MGWPRDPDQEHRGGGLHPKRGGCRGRVPGGIYIQYFVVLRERGWVSIRTTGQTLWYSRYMYSTLWSLFFIKQSCRSWRLQYSLWVNLTNRETEFSRSHLLNKGESCSRNTIILKGMKDYIELTHTVALLNIQEFSLDSHSLPLTRSQRQRLIF